MPTVFEANFDGSDTVRCFHISLVRLYLDQANENARASISSGADAELVRSITAIMFSAMALEAFVNEVSEDVIENNEMDNFVRLKKPFKIQKNEGSICAKLRIIFERKYKYELEDEYTDRIIELANYRNSLVHYKLTDTAGKIILPPVTHTKLDDGRTMSTIDFMAKPKRIEPPFIYRINSKSAVSAFNAALTVILLWGNLSGIEDSVPGLSVIV